MAEDTTNRLAGVANIQIGGQNYLLQGELSYSPSTVTRETLAGQDQVHGFKEMPVAGHIAGTLRDTNSFSVQTFNQMTNVTVNLSLANGKQIIGRNMWCVGAQDVKATEATFEVRFEGNSVYEVL